MDPLPAITSAATLIADPGRAAMLLMLVDGEPSWPASSPLVPGYQPRPRVPIWPSSWLAVC
jgi:hypothetical protein